VTRRYTLDTLGTKYDILNKHTELQQTSWNECEKKWSKTTLFSVKTQLLNRTEYSNEVEKLYMSIFRISL